MRIYLFKEIDSENLTTQLNAQEYINYWLNEDVLKKETNILSKIKSKTTDKNWKMRYKAVSV